MIIRLLVEYKRPLETHDTQWSVNVMPPDSGPRRKPVRKRDISSGSDAQERKIDPVCVCMSCFNCTLVLQV